ncbi:MAG: Glycosyl transferase family 39 [Microgenomates group bacterium Gr01-1014_7]|nr:MAG: Glycosyl transferase family 39 [Microgenomates group bacterium Gr01-1014_7]
MLLKTLKTHLFLIILILFAATPRLLWLDHFPISMAYDELNYVLNAKSFFRSSQNIPWTASSLFSWGEKDFDIVISEIPSLINSIWVGPHLLSQFNARLPNAIMAILSVIFVYLITRILLNETIAKIAGVFMAASPWNIHLGRTALELSPAVFFFLFGIYLILKERSYKILLSLPIFVCGFLSYLGAKLLFLPIITILLIYKFKTVKDGPKLPYLVYFLVSLLIILIYFLTLTFQPAGTRKGELLIFNPEWSKHVVDNERRQAIPNPALTLFSNKAVALSQRVIDTYISSFSTTNLFSKGETISVYSTWEYGQLHYIDLILIAIGLLVLFTYYRKAFYLLVSLIVVSPFASAIDIVQETYAVRSFPLFPLLIIVSAVGFWFIREKLKFGKVLSVIIGVVYLISFLYFLHLYFFRFPIYSAERWMFSQRLAANYARLAQNKDGIKKVYIVTIHSSKWAFEEYLFYSGVYNTSDQVKRINEKMKVRDFSDGKVVFLEKCPKMRDFTEGDVKIYDRRVDCGEKEAGNHGFVDLKDAGTVMIIENDILCQDNPDLQRYSRVRSLKDLEIESQNVEQFCRNWVSKF